MIRLLRFEVDRARSHYVSARAAIGSAEKRRLVIAEIMGDIYYALLEQIEASGYEVFHGTVRVRRHHKMALALRAFTRAKLGLM
jgi:phytoene synthase